MAHSLDPDILKYLAQPANIRLAFEIASYAEGLKRDLLKGFWDNIYSEIVKTRPKGRSVDEFVFSRPTVVDERWVNFRAVTRGSLAQPRQLAVTIEHHLQERNYDIYVGLHWNIEIPTKHPLYANPPLQPLKQAFDAAGSENFNAYWIGWRTLHSFDSPEEFLCTYLDDRQAILEPIATAFWSIVDHHQKDVDEVNKAIATF